ncbi:MAG: NAD(P)H-binding protein [Deltaproteobacteria bacterium]|jgi:uncharacterized protein YbjT (DUF2867 family)|nr:NAD(P)H-binding protein [Deltaproteobacteria bacterium]MBW2533272.1 NAD(P)H-binding protein [Deltaproteobacteria bacterium]
MADNPTAPQSDRPTVLLTGATGFVGRHLYPVLDFAGFEVRCASRAPERARERHPDRCWVKLDIDRPDTLARALEGCHSAVYLIHSMGQGGDFEQLERRAAEEFAGAAARAGLQRLVFLGGIEPTGTPSKHLRSRLATGEVLRAGKVPTVELRAGMIVGVGSESWNIVRDLAVRLPVMVLPKWLSNVSEPVAIDDVVLAIAHALDLGDDQVGCYDLPGPERLSSRDILMRIAAIHGTRPWTVNVPVVTPSLSSHWIRLVTRANYQVARQLVEGLVHDLVATGPVYWDLLGDHQLVPFDDAARKALRQEQEGIPISIRTLEGALQRIAPRSR